MLVLTRKTQERIQIGDNVTITVVRIKGNTVRVGIEAPQEIRVVRGELAEREKADASSGDSREAGQAAASLEDDAVAGTTRLSVVGRSARSVSVAGIGIPPVRPESETAYAV
jgi:carbon storage regulator